VAKKIVYGSHAEEKFEILRRHGFVVSKRQVRETLQRPERLKRALEGEKSRNGEFPRSMFYEVVYEEGQRQIKVVTFYPGRRSRYESSI
jgi:hypothetical protein